MTPGLVGQCDGHGIGAGAVGIGEEESWGLLLIGGLALNTGLVLDDEVGQLASLLRLGVHDKPTEIITLAAPGIAGKREGS